MPPLPAPWSLKQDDLFKKLGTSSSGLSQQEAQKRLASAGQNDIQTEKAHPALKILASQFTSPLVLVLIGASLISFSLGDRTETTIILAMVVLGGLLAFIQEYRSERALRELRKSLSRTITVVRNGKPQTVDTKEIVVGDIIDLELGNVVPADLRLLSVEDLQIDESTITGESVPVVKFAAEIPGSKLLPQEQSNIVFSGTHVIQGSGQGVVIATGAQTLLGKTAALLAEKTDQTEFQRGIHEFGVFLLKVTLGLAGVIFIILGLLRGEWGASLLFALALAVGISPELLPVIVTINLSRGALAMSKKHVLIKRLIAIEDLGNADVFCTDKTGTLTVGKLRVRGAIDTNGDASELPLLLGSSCLDIDKRGRASNAVDAAILDASKAHEIPVLDDKRIDIISFDFIRRRMSCVLEERDGQRRIIVKGAVAEVLKACTSRYLEKAHRSLTLTQPDREEILRCADRYGDQGYRLVAVARRPIDNKPTYSADDEQRLELIGFILVSDAPKQTAKHALMTLKDLQTRIVILTGDNERVTQHVAEQLGFQIRGMHTGDEVEAMSDDELQAAVDHANVFARITPVHKLRIIKALKAAGHTVGFMGDGVNDAPALRAADVGISFDDATDVAKEAASVILLKKNLSVLADGIREGRRTFVNIRTYLYATISSNFGNMLSVAGAALLLPFIPLLPAQILLLNLLSDIPMLAIPSDHVDEDELRRPHSWSIPNISNFMYFFGTISSLADYAMFAILLFVAKAEPTLFRSGWFLGSMLTEVIIIFLIRSRKLSLANPPGRILTVASLAMVVATFFILQTPSIAKEFDLVPLNGMLVAQIFLIVLVYAILTEAGKVVYYRFRDQTRKQLPRTV